MTAEIAILNKEAIALAADSAVTAGRGEGMKIFTTANKIFMLCPDRPVGVMVFNNAQFVGVPWETVICEIGKAIPGHGFKTLDEYARLFLGYFEKESYLFPREEQRRYFTEYVYYCCSMTRDVIVARVDEELKRRRPLSPRSIQILTSKVIKEELDDWVRLKKNEGSSSVKLNVSKQIVKYYRSSVQEVVDRVFQRIPVSKRTKKNLFEIIERYVSYGGNEWQNSGVVIAGFGEREAFPSLKSFTFDGLFNGKLKYFRGANTIVGKTSTGSILAFAQREMVARFMEGVDPDYREAEKKFMSQLSEKLPDAIVKNLRKYTSQQRQNLSKKIKDKCHRVFADYVKGMDKAIERHFTAPVIRVVAILPKSEMAALAEALVSLTSIKRKFSSVSETVAEPIDVAVISRSDGFVWIKKKRYYS
jgi:hypothetical protein